MPATKKGRAEYAFWLLTLLRNISLTHKRANLRFLADLSYHAGTGNRTARRKSSNAIMLARHIPTPA